MTTVSQTKVCTRYEKKTSRVKRKTNPETTQQGKSQRVHPGANRPLGKSEKTRKNTPLPTIFKTMARTCHGEELSCNTEVTFTVPIATTPSATRSAIQSPDFRQKITAPTVKQRNAEAMVSARGMVA